MCFIGLFFLTRSSFGRICIAIGQNEQRIELIGYDVRKYKTILFAIGGGLAGLSGALYASWAEIVTPNLFSLGPKRRNNHLVHRWWCGQAYLDLFLVQYYWVC